LGKDYFSVWTDQVVVAFQNVRADNVDVKERLPDQLFHTSPASAQMEGEAEFPSNCILKLDAFLVVLLCL
jgi:hypothetical protein